MSGLTYKDSGVDIDAGERLVDRIKPIAARTRTAEVMGSVGGFAGLCNLPSDIEDPVLVSGTDGVGTKLKVAFAADRHSTIGIDLVAMCVNDIVTCGARPLFFLDYFATGGLDVDQGASVIEGIAEGCLQAGCALLGGETAELPGFYKTGEYDLAGFSVGVVGRAKIIDGSRVASGNVLIGLPSTGLHSNGYSLARKALLHAVGDEAPLSLEDTPEALGKSVAEALLTPTRIYAKPVLAAIEQGGVHAVSHITGGGLPGNLPRVLPDGCCAVVDRSAWQEPAIFQLIQQRGQIQEAEMDRTFNRGVGMVLVVAQERADVIIDTLELAGESPFRLGNIEASEAGQGASLRYLDASAP